MGKYPSWSKNIFRNENYLHELYSSLVNSILETTNNGLPTLLPTVKQVIGLFSDRLEVKKKQTKIL